MTSPAPRSVVVRLAMDTGSYTASASRAEASTLSLDKAVQKVGPSAATSMERAASGAGTAEGALGKLNNTAGTLGFTLGGLAGVGGTIAAALSVKWAGDYQSALTRLVTTAGEAPKNLKMVSQGLLDMAGQVGITADELAKGAYTAESGGYHGADALLVMKSAAQGAKQENADLGKVTDAVTTILHDYHLKASDAATVTSQLVTAVSHGKTTFDELTGSLHSVTPLAAKMGISIADITGTLASMTASGESADQATQNMANTLQHLANPTQTMINELAQLGISTDDLATSLSTKGLAGTLQMVETAIVAHVDPATQRVLLPALNQSKTAAQDLKIMLGQMPPALAKMSQSMLDGTTTQGDYRKSAQALGGQAGVMADQFLSLYKTSDGFNNVIKAGGPAAQVFTAAMSKALGTTAALNVSLQTTGENAGTTNAAIADIAKASGDAKGNIKGWDEVQGNFNQKLAQAEAGAKSLAIEAGQHLLPILSSGLGWLASTGVPAVKDFAGWLEHVGQQHDVQAVLHGIGDGFHLVGDGLKPVVAVGGDVLHLLESLPGPVRDVVLALAALKAASALNLFSGFGRNAEGELAGVSGAVRGAGGAVSTFFDTVRVQSALAGEELSVLKADGGALAAGFEASMPRASAAVRGWASSVALSAAEVKGSFLEAKTAQEGMTALNLGAGSVSKSTGDLAGFTAAAKTATKEGLGGLKAAAGGVVSFLGGPWVVGLGAAAAAVWGYNAAMEAQSQRMKDLSSQYLALEKAQLAGGDTGQQAAAKLAQLNRDLSDAQKAYEEAAKAADHGASSNEGYEQGLAIMGDQLKQQQNAIGAAKTAITEYENKLGPVGIAQAKVASAQADYNREANTFGLNAPQTIAAAGRLRDAQDGLATTTSQVAAATQSQIDKMNILATKQLMSADAGLAATQAQLTLSNSIDQYNKDAKAGADFTGNLTQEGTSLAQQAYQTAQAVANQAVKQLEANGKTDDGTVANAILLKSLQDSASHLTGPARAAIDQYIKALQGTAVNTADMSDVTGKMGLHVAGVWDANTQVISGATAQQITDLGNLGYTVMHLPDGKVVVTSDTGPARDQMQALVDSYKNYSININPQGMALTTAQRNALYGADGGIVHMYAAGGIEQMRGDVAQVVSPGTLRVIGDNPVADEAFIPLNGSKRSRSILTEAASRMGYGLMPMASGGILVTEPARFSDAYMQAAFSLIARMGAMAKANAAAAPGAPAAVSGNVALGQQLAAARGWTGAEWNALYALWQRESGWRNTAQNPTSTAYGIPQFLNGTWASTGYAKTSDPRIQILAGENYIANRFVDPIGAWAHEQRFGWYHGGGTVQGPDGATVPAFLKVGETVRTTEQEDQVQRVMRTREVAGSSFAPAVVHHTDARAYPISFNGAGLNEEQLARKVRDGQRDLEFLHG